MKFNKANAKSYTWDGTTLYTVQAGVCLRSNFEEKEALMDNKLNINQQWALATKANPIMGCISKSFQQVQEKGHFPSLWHL